MYATAFILMGSTRQIAQTESATVGLIDSFKEEFGDFPIIYKILAEIFLLALHHEYRLKPFSFLVDNCIRRSNC